MDIVFPHKNEKEFIDIAAKLGTKKLYLIYPHQKNIKPYQEIIQRQQKNTRIKLLFGLIAEPQDIIKAKKLSNFVITRSSGTNQHTIEKLKPNLIFDLEQTTKKDPLHFRASGLNQVLCKSAQKNNVMIGFSFSSTLNSTRIQRAILLGRIAQNIALCKKYKVKTLFASFAKKPFEMRSLKDLTSLATILGK